MIMTKNAQFYKSTIFYEFWESTISLSLAKIRFCTLFQTYENGLKFGKKIFWNNFSYAKKSKKLNGIVCFLIKTFLVALN